ncbi:hypothetical protein ABEV55_19265 [Aneurinibacillus thermoaerophilus]|uniref:hypothetical protein n=1 Tax=Aneurinibacillus thermoaerophilus TaxID=143495 RepID=UPI002E22E5CE|nr:hypothetical protein [Aneurinibacillus thermoaerophilus]
MAILANLRGKKGQSTEPIVVVRSFMNALFDIEKDYHTDEKYTVTGREAKKEYLLHHLTNADLQVAIILQKVCNTRGYIRNVLPYTIYKKLEEYFEEPISESQFYASLTKLTHHHLIEIKKVAGSPKSDVILHHYAENGKTNSFVLMHPIVFTAAFNRLELAKKKLFFSVYLQQNSGKPIERLIQSNDDTEKSVQYSGLSRFLHRDSSHIQAICKELTSEKINGKAPLFEQATVVKIRGRVHKVVLSIHPSYFAPKKKGEYHDIITPVLIYPRKASVFTSMLDKLGIGEIAALEGGTVLATLMDILKICSARVIQYVAKRLKEFYENHGKLPEHIVAFVKKEIRNRTRATILGTIYKYQLDRFVAPYAKSIAEHYEKEDTLVSTLSAFGYRAIEKACKAASRMLYAHYTKPAVSNVTIDLYNLSSGLHTWKDITAIRYYAYYHRKDPSKYVQLELEAAKKYNYLGSQDLKEWMFARIDELPTIENMPAVPHNFKLEEYLLCYLT